MKRDKGFNRNHSVTMILAVLREGNRHGYDIAREVERRSGNRVNFQDGTLYPILRSMEAEGLIVSNWEGSEGERQRRIYMITESGLGEFQRQMEAWKEYSTAVNNVLGEADFSLFERG